MTLALSTGKFFQTRIHDYFQADFIKKNNIKNEFQIFFSYCFQAYPDVVAFLIGWTNIILCKPASLAVIVIAFAEYATAPFYPGCDPPEILQKFIVKDIISGLPSKHFSQISSDSVTR